MAAFDTVFTPKSVTPSTTTNTVLFTVGTDSASGQDVSVLVDVVVSGTVNVKVWVGVTPSGGLLHWKLYDTLVYVGDPVLALGPWFLQSGDVITVRADATNVATFSVTGLESS